MAFSNIDNLKLGRFLQIAFSEGVRSQISADYRDFEDIKSQRVGDPNGRELRFFFQTSLGSAGVQWRNPNGSSVFPTAQQISVSENSAVFKELDTTVEIEYNLWKRAQKSPAKYAEPLAIEIQSKAIAAKRQIALSLFGDGTGVMATCTAVDDTNIAAGNITVTLSVATAIRGFIGNLEYGDLLLAKASNAAAVSPSGGTGANFYAYRVLSKDRTAGTAVLELVSSAGALTPNYAASNIVNGTLLYRVGQPTIADLTGAIADYGSITEVMAGLESLTASDGRVIHGITMSGASAGSRLSGAGAALDAEMLRKLMDQVKIRVGQGKYRWNKVIGAPEAIGTFIDSRETDRRFQSIDDVARGCKKFVYVHGEDTLELFSSEFCPIQRMFALPVAKSGPDKVMELHMSDFEAVKAQGASEFMLKPSSSGGHERKMVNYMEAVMTLICKHPAAVAVLHNFVV